MSQNLKNISSLEFKNTTGPRYGPLNKGVSMEERNRIRDKYTDKIIHDVKSLEGWDDLIKTCVKLSIIECELEIFKLEMKEREVKNGLRD